MGKRLFVAVDIDEATREQVGRISSDLRTRIEARMKASWVRPDRMHLTLHFFGDADAVLEERVRIALAELVDEPSFDISFQRLGLFPERGSPRVLWLGIRNGMDALRRIHSSLAARVGTPLAAGQPFTPHLTLARFRERRPRAQLAEIAHIPATAGPSRIDRVTLYESRLSPAGPTYVPLAEGPLRT